MHVWKSTSAVCGVALFSLLCVCARSEAATEFCPAKVGDLSPIAAPMGTPARSYVYDLTALGARSVDASIVADTDRGWWSWNVAAVPLQKTSRVTATFFGRNFSRIYAASQPLAVAFPSSVIVRHAWIVSATDSADASRAVPAGQRFACDVPAFESASITDPRVDAAGRPRPSPTPLPSPAAIPVLASPSKPPFEAAECAKPFRVARAVAPMQPEYPESARDLGLGPTVAVAYVAVDERGTLTDTWIAASSGNQAEDLETLRAARLSSYAGGVSYCRPVKDLYLFRADFRA
jgi:hypothetical protein